ncbi:HNH endonuclease [Candidatus Bipolaricaulota bacterium]|nr:HNH endonuclease [Candidatus Bipolaricaulota bacterium]
MYLPEDLHQRLRTKFLELQLEGNKEGLELEKNRDFYPKVIQAGLENIEDEDILEG